MEQKYERNLHIDAIKQNIDKLNSTMDDSSKPSIKNQYGHTWEWVQEMQLELAEVWRFLHGIDMRIKALENPPKPKGQPFISSTGRTIGYVHSDRTVRRHAEDE